MRRNGRRRWAVGKIVVVIVIVIRRADKAKSNNRGAKGGGRSIGAARAGGRDRDPLYPSIVLLCIVFVGLGGDGGSTFGVNYTCSDFLLFFCQILTSCKHRFLINYQVASSERDVNYASKSQHCQEPLALK